VVLWSRGGLTWRSRVGANPIPIQTPLIWRYLGIKTIYRFNQGGSYYCRGLKWEQGAEPPSTPPPNPLTLTTVFEGGFHTAMRREWTCTTPKASSVVWNLPSYQWKPVVASWLRQLYTKDQIRHWRGSCREILITRRALTTSTDHLSRFHHPPRGARS